MSVKRDDEKPQAARAYLEKRGYMVRRALMTPAEVAEFLGVSSAHVKRLPIRATNVGLGVNRALRFAFADVERWMERCAVDPATEATP